MKSQVPLPTVFLNESCSSSQEYTKPHKCRALAAGLTCTGLPVDTEPSCVICVGGAGTASFPREINTKHGCVSRPTSVVGSPGWGRTVTPFALQTICDCFIHSFPGQTLHNFMPPRRSPCSTSWLRASSQFTLHSNNVKWFCSLPNADRAGKWALIPSGKAILLYAKLWQLKLQINTMRRLESVQHNCSECTLC